MVTSKNDYLETLELFEGLSDEDLQRIGHTTRLVEHAAGYIFYMPDEPAEVMFILKQGRVQLYRMSTDGRKLVVAVMQPGAVFGHMSLIGQGLHNTYAEALDDCVICVWSRDEVERLLVRRPEVALRFLDALGKRLMQVEKRLTDRAFKRVPARLAGLLLYLRQGDDIDVRGYTHQGLADMLGTYRETVTQTLTDFKEQGLIDVGRKRITLLDSNALLAIEEEG
jgi:CRP-like cAMP-binding protein